MLSLSIYTHMQKAVGSEYFKQKWFSCGFRIVVSRQIQKESVMTSVS